MGAISSMRSRLPTPQAICGVCPGLFCRVGTGGTRGALACMMRAYKIKGHFAGYMYNWKWYARHQIPCKQKLQRRHTSENREQTCERSVCVNSCQKQRSTLSTICRSETTKKRIGYPGARCLDSSPTYVLCQCQLKHGDSLHLLPSHWEWAYILVGNGRSH